MNNDVAAGKINQLKGKTKQSVGEAIGNQRLANSGAADQVKGAVQEAWGNAKDAFQTIADETRASVSTKHSEAARNAAGKAHDVRERIVSAAQKVKNTVNAKAESIHRQRSHTP